MHNGWIIPHTLILAKATIWFWYHMLTTDPGISKKQFIIIRGALPSIVLLQFVQEEMDIINLSSSRFVYQCVKMWAQTTEFLPYENKHEKSITLMFRMDYEPSKWPKLGTEFKR